MDEKTTGLTEAQLAPQNMHSLFDNVIARWKDDGPVQGHIKALEKNKPRQQLFLKKDKPNGDNPTHYVLDIIDENTHLKKQVELAVTPSGTEKATYRVFSEHTSDPIEIELTEEDRRKLEHDLITRSRWGTEKTFNPFGYLDVSQIPEESLLQQLGLDSLEMPRQVIESARKSQWYSIDNGRIILEVRNPDVLKRPRSGSLQLSDFDDTIFGSNNQHKNEYQLLENDSKLNKRGIRISAKRAEDIYQLSKILVPGFADKEPRYTPRLNLVLLTMYAESLKKMPETEAFEQMNRELTKINALSNKENYIASYAIDPDILNIYKSTDLGKFLYRDFAEDFLTGTEPEDMRVIVTRGKIGGLLGQIQKIHQCGIFNQDFSVSGINDDGTPITSVIRQNNVELVVYTSDLKAETLTLIPQLFPGFTNKPIRIYDDNLDELREYYDWAKENHLKTLEMIRVRHDQARRRNKTLTFAKPVERTGAKLGDRDKDVELQDEKLPDIGETIYDTYTPYPNDVLPFPDYKEKSPVS